MAKSLRDIIGPRAGRQLPKPEEEFLDKHTVDVKDYPIKQKKEAVPHKDTSIEKDDHKKSPQNEETFVEEKDKKIYLDKIRKKTMNRISGSADTKTTYPDVTADNNAGARI